MIRMNFCGAAGNLQTFLITCFSLDSNLYLRYLECNVLRWLDGYQVYNL